MAYIIRMHCFFFYIFLLLIFFGNYIYVYLMTGSRFITNNAFIQSVERGTSQNNQASHEIDLRSESTISEKNWQL